MGYSANWDKLYGTDKLLEVEDIDEGAIDIEDVDLDEDEDISGFAPVEDEDEDEDRLDPITIDLEEV